MLTAKVGNEIINCYDGTHTYETLKKWSKKKILICPVCNKPYEYCHGKVIDSYFRHKDKKQCENKYSEPETDEHINGKRDLYEWIKMQCGITDVILEGWIPETKQRPDIMFKYNGIPYVIEYQCTPIASEYLERHELYKTAGINDIWICGTDKYFGVNKRLNVLEKECRIYYSPQYKYFYKMEDLSEKQIKNIQRISLYRRHLTNYYRMKMYYTREFHLMMNVYDYNKNYKNYILIKNTSNNYQCIGSHYPSPTGRPSNKYPYPVKDYAFIGNYSYASCYYLPYIKLKSIGGNENE